MKLMNKLILLQIRKDLLVNKILKPKSQMILDNNLHHSHVICFIAGILLIIFYIIKMYNRNNCLLGVHI